MKKFMKCVLEWKTGVSLSFTASMLIYVVIALLMGEKQVEATSVFAMLAASAWALLSATVAPDTTPPSLSATVKPKPLTLFSVLFTTSLV